MAFLALEPGWKMVKFGEVVRQCKKSVDRDNNSFHPTLAYQKYQITLKSSSCAVKSA